MPKILMPYTVHLDHTLRVTPVSTLFYKGDSNAHRFELNVLSKGLQADLSGCSAVYRFYRLQDSTVVSNPASIESGKVVAVLDKACYDYIGRFALTIAIQNGEDETTVFYGDGYMSGNRADTGITGDYVVYDVETLLAKIAEIETAIENANTATENANTATENANTATENAQSAAGSANAAASAANTAAGKANTAASTAETAASTANSAASSAQTATQNANAATQASKTQQQAVAEAEAARDTAEQERATAEQARHETFSGYEERIVAATPDDTTVDGRAWTSKKTVDSLCLPFEASGNPVQVYPVEGYPLGVKVSWEPAQEGSGDPSPDNIRPITGRDAVSVTRCGRNIVGSQYQPGSTRVVNGLTFTVNDDYSVTVSGTATALTFYDFKPLKNILLLERNVDAMGKTVTEGGYTLRDVVCENTAYKGSCYMYLMFNKGTVVDATYYPTIVYGSTATPYEPYTGSTTDIALPETVYGGTLDLETGVVTVEHYVITFSGEENWILTSDGYFHVFRLLPDEKKPFSKDGYDAYDNKCTHFLYKVDYSGNAIFLTATGYVYCGKGLVSKYGSLTDFKAYLAAQYAAGTPVQICYKLAEPYTIQLTQQQIAALSGVNTLYTDAGTLTVTGREDPRHTIVTLTDRIAALESAAAGV